MCVTSILSFFWSYGDFLLLQKLKDFINPIANFDRQCDSTHEGTICVINQRRAVENWFLILGIDGWKSVVVLKVYQPVETIEIPPVILVFRFYVHL